MCREYRYEIYPISNYCIRIDIRFIIMSSLTNYNDAVIDYLEYIGYPYYVADFNTNDVARSVTNSIVRFWQLKISPRMAAISIFALTMELQVMRNKGSIH